MSDKKQGNTQQYCEIFSATREKKLTPRCHREISRRPEVMGNMHRATKVNWRSFARKRTEEKKDVTNVTQKKPGKEGKSELPRKKKGTR